MDNLVERAREVAALVLKDEMREHVACLHQNSLPDLLDMIPVRSISSMVTGWVIS